MRIRECFTEQEVDCALCIFDQFIDCIISEYKTGFPLVDFVHEIKNIGGTPKLREVAMMLAKPIEQAWKENGEMAEKYLGCFDLEFIPELLAEAVLENDFPDLSQNDWGKLTNQVLLSNQVGSDVND